MNASQIRSLTVAVLLASALAGAFPAQAGVKRAAATQSETFQVATNAHIAVGTNHKAALADIKVGDRVGIGYVEENGVQTAHRISDGVPPKQTTTSSTTPSTKPSHHNGTTLLHVHGVVQSVDTGAGTITITHRVK